MGDLSIEEICHKCDDVTESPVLSQSPGNCAACTSSARPTPYELSIPSSSVDEELEELFSTV